MQMHVYLSRNCLTKKCAIGELLELVYIYIYIYQYMKRRCVESARQADARCIVLAPIYYIHIYIYKSLAGICSLKSAQ